MLVFAARRVRSERRNADPVFALDRLRVPSTGRAIRFRRQPALDVPAVYRRIFRFNPQFNALSYKSTVLVAILEFPADPREAVPAPHCPVIRFPEAIPSPGLFETSRDTFRRLVRLAYNSNHFARGENSTVFTTNFWSPQSSINSLTFAI